MHKNAPKMQKNIKNIVCSQEKGHFQRPHSLNVLRILKMLVSYFVKVYSSLFFADKVKLWHH